MAAPLAQAQVYSYGDYAYYVNLDGATTLTGYTGPGGAVTIAGTINGALVTSLVFTSDRCTGLTTITLNDTI